MNMYGLVLLFTILESYVLLNVMSLVFSYLMMQQLCGLPDIEDFAYKKNIESPSSSKSHHYIRSELHIPNHSLNLISITR